MLGAKELAREQCLYTVSCITKGEAQRPLLFMKWNNGILYAFISFFVSEGERDLPKRERLGASISGEMPGSAAASVTSDGPTGGMQIRAGQLN